MGDPLNVNNGKGVMKTIAELVKKELLILAKKLIIYGIAFTFKP